MRYPCMISRESVTRHTGYSTMQGSCESKPEIVSCGSHSSNKTAFSCQMNCYRYILETFSFLSARNARSKVATNKNNKSARTWKYLTWQYTVAVIYPDYLSNPEPHGHRVRVRVHSRSLLYLYVSRLAATWLRHWH